MPRPDQHRLSKTAQRRIIEAIRRELPREARGDDMSIMAVLDAMAADMTVSYFVYYLGRDPDEATVQNILTTLVANSLWQAVQILEINFSGLDLARLIATLPPPPPLSEMVAAVAAAGAATAPTSARTH